MAPVQRGFLLWFFFSPYYSIGDTISSRMRCVNMKAKGICRGVTGAVMAYVGMEVYAWGSWSTVALGGIIELPDQVGIRTTDKGSG